MFIELMINGKVVMATKHSTDIQYIRTGIQWGMV